jgi:hypothetical protein
MMSPSQQRQLKWWLRFWMMVGGAFAVTLAAMARLAEWYRDDNGLSEKSQAMIRAAVQSDMIQATPIRTLGNLEPAIIIVRPPGNDPPLPPTAPPPGDSVTPPSITFIREANGALIFNATSTSGKTYVLDASLDLKAWVPIGTNTATSSIVSFWLSNSPIGGSAFYRLRTEGVPVFVSPTTGSFVSPTVGTQASPTRGFSRVVSNTDAVAR